MIQNNLPPNPVDERGMTSQPLCYSEEDHQTWKYLVQRQTEKLKGKICDEYFAGLALLDFPVDRVPQITELSQRLKSISNFELVCVGGLISSQTFFECLAARQFTVGWFVRKSHQIDYLPEPDLFHDLFGHVPLLTNPYYADFMQKIGLLGLDIVARFKQEPHQCEIISNALLRLYWFTIEFGLMKPVGKKTCIYGAGIASSYREVEHSLYASEVNRVFLEDIGRVVRTKYSIHEMQRLYFVIESFEKLYSLFSRSDLLDVIIAARQGTMLDKNIVLGHDRLLIEKT